MEKCRQYISMAIAIMMLLTVGCQRSDVIDRNDPDNYTGELRFRPSLGEEYVSRAGESDNGVLQRSSEAGDTPPHIVIKTYTGTPGSSLKTYFSDELGYFTSGNYWDVNSGELRFLPSGGMNLYAYFATDYTEKGDLANVIYTEPVSETEHPKLSFTVDTDDALNQVDLIAAKAEGITSTEVLVPFRHILSQINFGVKGIDQHQITVKNIRINKVVGIGSFDYKTWLWTPDAKATTQTYPYYFPDRKKGDPHSGLGDNYKTRATVNDSQNSYIFGDGGMFGPGSDTTFLYAQVDPTASHYATEDGTLTPLHNSLMLMPQVVTANTDATVTFDYEIRLYDKVVRSGKDNVIRLDAYHDWKPNMRYVYIFKFDNPSEKVTFDVIVEPWQNYDDDDGIVDTDELNPVTLFEKYVRPLEPGETYSVPLSTLTSDFICEWSLYTVDNSFVKDQQFTLSFEEDAPFTNGKSIIITPPFGFRASTSKLSAKGDVTFTAIHSYYATATELNTAISNGGNHEVSVRDAVKLDDIRFSGSVNAESALTLHYLTQYSGKLPPRWQLYNAKTAVCFPNDYALIGSSPYTYTIYTVDGLYDVLNWMNTGGTNPGGNTETPDAAERMKTNINLAKIGRYDLATAYKSSGDATKPQYVPIGTDTNPYLGTFNGNGATVENLYIGYGSGRDWEGLFGYIGGTGRVKFINLENVSIYSGAATFVGGIAGMSMSGSIITGCSVSGTIYGGYTGGIVGQNSGLIYSCGSTAALTTFSTGNVGGIAGVNWNLIQGCYSTSSNVNIAGANYQGAESKNFYVASSDMGTNHASATRVPSIAALNGKIPQLNSSGAALYTGAHFVSGNLNATPPSIAAGEPANRLNGGVLKGTFIQNWFALSWGEARWDAEMALLATLGMEYLVIDQVVVYSDYGDGKQYMSWYPASQSVLVNDSYTISGNTSLESCMKACRAHGIKLYIGTFFDNRYWDDGAAVSNPAQWNNCITTANRVMDELTTFYFSGAGSTKGNYDDVLAGWYFPYEVDDLNFQTSEAQGILKAGILTAMTHRTKNSKTDKPYLFSPFMNGALATNTMNAAEYEALWRDIINTAGFKSGDILSPQDCIGVGKLTIGELATWMPALRRAANPDVTGVQFWINVELFGPAADVTFLTTQQISANNPYADKLISFSYPIHYSPNTGNHNTYKAYYDAQ